MVSIEVHSSSVSQTRQIGEKLAQGVVSGDVIDLRGPLGAGKTAFAQGFARGLGIHDQVTSPTFLMVKSYVGRFDLLHCDLYRTSGPADVEMLGIYEELDAEAVGIVEWGERANGELDAVVIVEFKPSEEGPNSRILEFTIRDDSVERFGSLWRIQGAR